MENKVDGLDDQANTPREGSGSLLAAARKKQNKSVEEIAAELNLSVTQIKTIELDQNEGLPEPTYVRGYIRSYARLLGLDAEQVLESYLNPNWQKGSSLDEMPKRLSNADEMGAKNFFTLSKVIMVLLVLSIVAFLWFSGLFTSLLSSFDNSGVKSNEQNSQVEQSLLSTSTASTENTTPLVANAIPVNSVTSAGNSTGNNNQPSSENIAEQQTPDSGALSNTDENQAASLEPQAAHNLVLNFIETCWVDIRDSNDKRLAYKSYYVGDELVVSDDVVLNVFLGNADGVKAIYNGESFDMSSYREGVYAKFSLGKN